jgi:hypothetical protein
MRQPHVTSSHISHEVNRPKTTAFPLAGTVTVSSKGTLYYITFFFTITTSYMFLIYSCIEMTVCVSRAPARAEAKDAFNVYHRAYHGTNVDAIPKILCEGQLLMPGGFIYTTDTFILANAWFSFAKANTGLLWSMSAKQNSSIGIPYTKLCILSA